MYILFSGLMALVASSPITKRSPIEIYVRRNPNEIFVGGQEHKKVCEVDIRTQRFDGEFVDMKVCRPPGPGSRNIAHSCKQEFIVHNDHLVPSACALHLVNGAEEEKHAKLKPNTKECVHGEGSGSLGFHEVFFVQETIKLPYGHVNAGCSTYLKD